MRSEWWFFFFQAEDGIRDYKVTGVQTCALPISPQAVVVSPLLCQSKPSTQPNAWNHTGSAIRRIRPGVPSLERIASTISRDNKVIRSNSQRGALPPWSGRSAVPVRIASVYGGLQAKKRAVGGGMPTAQTDSSSTS